MMRRKALNSRLLERADSRVKLKVDRVHERLRQDFLSEEQKIQENGLANSGPARIILLRVQTTAVKDRVEATWEALREVIADEIKYGPTLAEELKDYVRSKVNYGGYTFLAHSQVLNLTRSEAEELNRLAEISKVEALAIVESEIDVFVSNRRRENAPKNVVAKVVATITTIGFIVAFVVDVESLYRLLKTMFSLNLP